MCVCVYFYIYIYIGHADWFQLRVIRNILTGGIIYQHSRGV